MSSAGRFDIQAIADELPETATTLLVDTYLTDGAEASSRVFRVYRPTPPHYKSRIWTGPTSFLQKRHCARDA